MKINRLAKIEPALGATMLRPFLILLVAIVFSVSGELLLKNGMNKVGLLSLRPSLFVPTLWRAFTTPQIIVGFVLAFAASIFWLAVISRVPLSYAYPMLSLSYVIVILASWLLLGEHFSLTRLIGAFIICSGVYVVFRS